MEADVEMKSPPWVLTLPATKVLSRMVTEVAVAIVMTGAELLVKELELMLHPRKLAPSK